MPWSPSFLLVFSPLLNCTYSSVFCFSSPTPLNMYKSTPLIKISFMSSRLMQLISAWISLLGCCHTQLKKHFPPSTLNLPFFSFKLYCILFFHHIERDIIQATCLIQCLIHFGLSEKLGTIINRVQVYSSIVNFDCIQSGVHFCLTSTLGLDPCSFMKV